MVTDVTDFMDHPPLQKLRHVTSSTDISIAIADEDKYNFSMSMDDDKYHDYGLVIKTILAVTMAIFMVFTFFGNTLVILTVLRHKGMKTRTNMFIVNLAIADILVAIFNMPFSLVTVVRGRWIFGDVFCQMNGFLMPLFFIVSIHTLMYISIHKYISITRPFSRAMTPSRIMWMIIASWVWGALCSISTVKGGNHVLYKKGASQCGPSIPNELIEYVHSIMITTCNYIIPLLVLSFCYFNIFREINEHMIRIRETSNVDLEKSLSQQRKISCTLILVLACFLVCWTPFIVYSSFAAFVKDKDKVYLLANPVAYWCGYMNSACNPIIYALRSPSFREGYKEIICSSSAYNIGVSKNIFSHQSTRFQQNIQYYFQGPIIPRSISTRPSMSQLTSVKVFSNRTENQERITLPGNKTIKIDETVKESKWQIRKNSLNIPKLIIDHDRTAYLNREDPSFNSRPNKQLLFKDFAILEQQHKQRTETKRAVSLTDVNSDSKIVQAPDRLSKSLWNINEKNFPINLEFESIRWMMESSDTIGRWLREFNSSDEEALNCPIVVIDEASLRSSSFGSTLTPGRRLSTNLSASLTLVEKTIAEGNQTDMEFLESESQWSPISTRSLEMGRRRESFKTNKGYTKVGLNKKRRRKSKIKPESPLYSASKEQLEKWMSQDYLDQIEVRSEASIDMGLDTHNDMPRRLTHY